MTEAAAVGPVFYLIHSDGSGNPFVMISIASASLIALSLRRNECIAIEYNKKIINWTEMIGT